MSYDLCIWNLVRHALLPATEGEALQTKERLSMAADWLGTTVEEFGHRP